MKRTGCLGLLLALMLLLTACSSGAGDSSAGSDYGNVDTAGDSWEMQGAETAGGETGTVSPTAANPSGDKMIYTANLTVETTSFDSAAQALAQATEALSGYFEDQHTTNTGSYRYASYTVRIPAEHFQEFLSQVGQICHVLDSSQNAEDVSEAYYDIEARLTTQRTKLERLQALLGQAEDMTDIITIESAISETELEIERLTGSLRDYDSRIQYATVTISLSEVAQLSNVEAPAVTFGARLGNAFLSACRGFVSCLENLAVFLARSWIILLILAGGTAAVVVILRRRKGKNHDGGDSSKA